MLKNNKFILYILLFVFIINSDVLRAQISISSPYSRYGIGDLQNNNSPLNMSMGGISIALKSPYFINTSNPASYSAFDSLSFVFESGAYSNIVQLGTNNLTENGNYTTLSNLKFGCPITKWWRSSIGLLPFSQVGYNIKDIENLEDIGKVEYLYKGSGGVNKFYWGNAIKINRNLSVGFNASYLFGTIDKTRYISFPDSVYFLNLRVKNFTKVNDFYINYGIQYYVKLKKNLELGSGVIFSNSTKIRAKDNIIAETFLPNISGVDIIKDTVENSPDVIGDIILPKNIGIGMVLKKSDKFMIGVDYQWQNWEKYSSFGEKDSLNNSMQLSSGVQIIPNSRSLNNYWEKINYRFGFRYSKTYLELRNNQLNEFGISFGLGFPIKRTNSTINIAAEVGQRGTTEHNLIKENYIKFTLGIAIYERWFIKRKFD